MRAPHTSPAQANTCLWPLTVLPDVDGGARGQVGSLENLYLGYKKPLEIHLRARFQTFPLVLNNSEDLLAGFVAEKLLRGGFLKQFNPSRGRFRFFLKRSMENYIWDWLKKQHWQPTEPGSTSTEAPEEALDRLASAQTQPQTDGFDLAWVQMLLQQTLGKLEQTCKDPAYPQPHRSHIWEIFRLRILDPAFTGSEPPSYEELVRRLGLRSPTEGTNLLLSAKRMFKKCLDTVVREYSGSDQEAKSELKVLQEFMEHIVQTGGSTP